MRIALGLALRMSLGLPIAISLLFMSWVIRSRFWVRGWPIVFRVSSVRGCLDVIDFSMI